MAPRVLGVELPREEEITPQSESLRQTLREEKERRVRDDRALTKRIEALEKKVATSNTLQWVVGALVTLVGIYVTWKSATQQTQIVAASEDKAVAVVESRLRQHLQSVEQTSLNIAVEAVRIRDVQIAEAQNPPPIASSPDRVAAKTRQR